MTRREDQTIPGAESSCLQRNSDVARLPLRCSTVEAANGKTLTGESYIQARWAGYFEELYCMENPTVSFLEMLTLSGKRTPLYAVIHPP